MVLIPPPKALERYMNRVEAYDDLSTVLFLVPFIITGVYGLYLWAQRGGLLLPTDTYLTVSRDPYVFLVGTFAVFAAVILEVWITERPKRLEKISSLSGLLQKLAAASFILAFICALYANGFDPSGTALDFIVGRYSLVFPALLVLLSYVMLIPLNTGAIGMRSGIGIVVMFLVPAVIYEVGKRDTFVGIAGGFILLLVGMAIFLWHRPRASEKETKETA